MCWSINTLAPLAKPYPSYFVLCQCSKILSITCFDNNLHHLATLPKPTPSQETHLHMDQPITYAIWQPFNQSDANNKSAKTKVKKGWTGNWSWNVRKQEQMYKDNTRWMSRRELVDKVPPPKKVYMGTYW